jgi:hypothetical protein
MDLAKTIASGVVVIGIITAFGLHAKGLSQVGKTGFAGTAKVFRAVEKP